MNNLPYSTFPYESERKARIAERRRQFRAFVQRMQRKQGMSQKVSAKPTAFGNALRKLPPKQHPREFRGHLIEGMLDGLKKGSGTS